MTRPSFTDLREVMSMSHEGQVLDSFIAVEIGLPDYEACWDAHLDVYADAEVVTTDESIITMFLTEVYDMLDIEEDAFERVLGASL